MPALAAHRAGLLRARDAVAEADDQLTGHELRRGGPFGLGRSKRSVALRARTRERGQDGERGQDRGNEGLPHYESV